MKALSILLLIANFALASNYSEFEREFKVGHEAYKDFEVEYEVLNQVFIPRERFAGRAWVDVKLGELDLRVSEFTIDMRNIDPGQPAGTQILSFDLNFVVNGKKQRTSIWKYYTSEIDVHFPAGKNACEAGAGNEGCRFAGDLRLSRETLPPAVEELKLYRGTLIVESVQFAGINYNILTGEWDGLYFVHSRRSEKQRLPRPIGGVSISND